MKIALLGASGTIGQRILNEAISRGHTVTAILRNPANSTIGGNGVNTVQGDITEPDSIVAAITGHDAVISSIGPGEGEETDLVAVAAQTLVDVLPDTGVRRLLIVGGAGGLEVAPGVRLIDTPEFPEAWKGIAQSQIDALDIYKTSDELDWTYISPAALIQPGVRTGKYRIATNQLVADAEGQSRISAEDYAIALLDQLENPEYLKQGIAVGY